MDRMDVEQILKPCPFCGNKAVQAYGKGKYGTFGFIQCVMCSAQSKTMKIIEPNQYDNEDRFWLQRAWESVIIAWNTRAHEQEGSNE